MYVQATRRKTRVVEFVGTEKIARQQEQLDKLTKVCFLAFSLVKDVVTFQGWGIGLWEFVIEDLSSVGVVSCRFPWRS